jgi:hypothetical protein
MDPFCHGLESPLGGVTRKVRRGLGTPGDLQLVQDAGDVVLHRLFGEEQLAANFRVRFAMRHEREDLLLLR